MKFEDIKCSLRKVLESIYIDREQLEIHSGSKAITAKSLGSAIGNHMCDDHPGCFGITQNEGHNIRDYFQDNGIAYGWREYILLLHQEFPDLMDKEDSKYIQDTNKERKRTGFSPIKYNRILKTYKI